MSEQPQVVFVVGASSGIGYGLALEFAARGWTVYAGSRNVAKMSPLKDKGVHVLYLDVTSQESIDTARDVIKQETKGQLDVLYLNAGMSRAGSVLEMPMKDIEDSFQTNAFGPLRVVRSFQQMLLKNHATVAFTGSVIVNTTFPFMYAYAASKASFDILAHYLAIECGDLGVKVVNVRSGAVESEIFDAPKFTPKEGSLYYTGKEEAIAILDPYKMATAKYCSTVVTTVERSIKKGTSFKEIYYGGGASFSWFVNKFVPYSVYHWLILKVTKMDKVFTILKERLTKDKRI